MQLFSVQIPDTLSAIHVGERDKQKMHCEWKGIAFGSYIFPSALALSEYLLENTHLFKDKRVLELGAGFGLAGLVCGRHGSAEVVITDALPQVVHNIKSVITGNGLDANVSASVLKWQDVTSTCNKNDTIQGHFDLIIASDVTYTLDALCIPTVLRRYLGPTGKCIILHEVRPDGKKKVIPRLKEACALEGFTIQEYPATFQSRDVWLKLAPAPPLLSDYYTAHQISNPDAIGLKLFAIS